jgi:hypothetical protein
MAFRQTCTAWRHIWLHLRIYINDNGVAHRRNFLPFSGHPDRLLVVELQLDEHVVVAYID